jgi:hypothetical protein
MSKQPLQQFCTTAGNYWHLPAVHRLRPQGEGGPADLSDCRVSSGSGLPAAACATQSQTARLWLPGASAELVGPVLAIALHGRLQLIFLYVTAGLVSLCILLFLAGMLARRRGREVLGEAAAEGCFEVLPGWLCGGG